MSVRTRPSTDELIRRLQKRFKERQSGSPAVQRFLNALGLEFKASAKIIARKKGIVDSGALIRSLDYQTFRRNGHTVMQAGSFGIVYAAMNELGGPVSPQQMRAMFATLRNRGKLKSKRKGKRPVIVNGYWRARPYIRPAFRRMIKLVNTIAKNSFK